MTDPRGTEKRDGEGSDGTIPPSEDGLAATLSEEASNFNEEEDPEAATTSDD